MDALRNAAHNEGDLNGLALMFLAEVSGLLTVSLRAQDQEDAERRVQSLNHVTSNDSEPLRGLAQIRSALMR